MCLGFWKEELAWNAQKAQEVLVNLLNQGKMNNAVRIIKLMYIKNITHQNINVASY